jgi:hypothetical protein
MRTDGHDEANRRFSQFCKSPYKEKKMKAVGSKVRHKAHVSSSE